MRIWKIAARYSPNEDALTWKYVRSRTADNARRNLERKDWVFREQVREADEFAKPITVELVKGKELTEVGREDIE